MFPMPKTPPANALFGCFGRSAQALSPPSGVIEIAKEGDLVLYSGVNTALGTYSSPESGATAWLWGASGIRDIKQAELPHWCMTKIISGDLAALRNLPGSWLLIVHEPAKQTLHIATDLLGMRPFFIGEKNDNIVFGSDAWSMFQAGWSTGSMNPNAIASWLTYYYNITDTALFEDLRRPLPGVVETYSAGARPSKFFYGSPRLVQPPSSEDEYVERFHGAVKEATDVLTGETPEVVIALSGGFDSRYLLALYRHYVGGNARALVVDAGQNELLPAKEAAEKLDVPLEVIEPGQIAATGAVWDIFEEPYHYTADGFPITKQFTLFAAQHAHGVPLLNGFLGDPLMRGTCSTCCGHFEHQCEGKYLENAYKQHEVMSWWWYLFDQDLTPAIQKRAMAAMDKLIKRAGDVGYPFRYADLYGRQRLYISNNVTQCLDYTETLLPFLNAELIDLRFSVGDKLPTMDMYRKIFQRYLPEIADVPHSSEIPRGKQAAPRLGRADKKWAYALLSSLILHNRPEAAKRLKSLKSILSCLTMNPNLQVAIEHLYRVLLLESCCEKQGVAIDWGKVADLSNAEE